MLCYIKLYTTDDDRMVENVLVFTFNNFLAFDIYIFLISNNYDIILFLYLM